MVKVHPKRFGAVCIGIGILVLAVVLCGVGYGRRGTGMAQELGRRKSDEVKIEFMVSRLEQCIRIGRSNAVLPMFRPADLASSLEGDELRFDKRLKLLLSSVSEDPRQKPIVDLVASSVDVTGSRAEAVVTVRVAREAGVGRWEVDETMIRLNLEKEGRGWYLCPSQEIVDIMIRRMHSARAMRDDSQREP